MCCPLDDANWEQLSNNIWIWVKVINDPKIFGEMHFGKKKVESRTKAYTLKVDENSRNYIFTWEKFVAYSFLDWIKKRTKQRLRVACCVLLPYLILQSSILVIKSQQISHDFFFGANDFNLSRIQQNEKNLSYQALNWKAPPVLTRQVGDRRGKFE